MRKKKNKLAETLILKKIRKIERRADGAVLYTDVMKDCGDKTCQKCPHGPYLIATYFVKGKRIRSHIGRIEHSKIPHHEGRTKATSEICPDCGEPIRWNFDKRIDKPG